MEFLDLVEVGLVQVLVLVDVLVVLEALVGAEVPRI